MTIVYQTVTAGASYSRTIAAPNAISFAAENLPTGLSISNSGVISGTLQQTGRFAITILARGAGGTGAAILDLTIVAPLIPFITSSGYSTPETTQAFTYQITASSPTAILSYNATNLPTGLSVDTSTGLISGTPTVNSQSPTVNIISRLSATNAAGTGEQDLYFLLRQRPVITSSLSTLDYALGVTITPYTITATRSATVFGASNLPPGLSINSSTGTITGSLSQVNQYNITLTASNGVLTGSANKIINVNTAPIFSAPFSFGNGLYGQSISFQPTIQAYPPVTLYSVTNLPGGLSFNSSTAEISGVPPAGVSNFSISATNPIGTTIQSYSASGTAAIAPTISSVYGYAQQGTYYGVTNYPLVAGSPYPSITIKKSDVNATNAPVPGGQLFTRRNFGIDPTFTYGYPEATGGWTVDGQPYTGGSALGFGTNVTYVENGFSRRIYNSLYNYDSTVWGVGANAGFGSWTFTFSLSNVAGSASITFTVNKVA